MSIRSDPKSSNRARVIVADDNLPMLDSLVRLLSKEHEVVAALLDGEAALDAAARYAPDVVVLDIAMPGMSGIAAAARMKAQGMAAKVVFVTMHHDREYVTESLAIGQVGFVVKDRLVSDLLPAVREVLAGHTFVSPSVAR